MRFCMNGIVTKKKKETASYQSVSAEMRGKAKVKTPPCHIQDRNGMQNDSGTKGSKSRWATNEDWSIHKATIKRLYLTENKPLWDVQDIMSTKYSFNATQPMYKKRLRSWRCSKYIRTSARPKENSISWSAAGLVIKSPDIFHIPETILLSIQDYVNERKDSKGPRKAVGYQTAPSTIQSHNYTAHALCRSTLDAIFTDARSGLDIEKFSRSAANFIDAVEACRELLADHQIKEAFSELRRLPDKIQVLLRDEPHHVLHGLFFAIIKLAWDGDDLGAENGILKALLAYVAAFTADSSLAWPEAYPLRRILEGFSQMRNQSDLAEVTIKCWKYFLEKSKPPGDETAGSSCVISSFSVPRDFENIAEAHKELNEPSQAFTPAYKRLGIDKRRARLQRRQNELEGFRRETMPAQDETVFKSQRYMSHAYEATGLKDCLKIYLDELVKEAVSKAQRKGDVRLVVLRMCRLEHMLSQWGDEENSQYARRNLVMFGGAEYYNISDR